jgi:hypothetical protein
MKWKENLDDRRRGTKEAEEDEHEEGKILDLSLRLYVCLISFRSSVLPSEGQTMDKVQKPSNTDTFRPKFRKPI